MKYDRLVPDPEMGYERVILALERYQKLSLEEAIMILDYTANEMGYMALIRMAQYRMIETNGNTIKLTEELRRDRKLLDLERRVKILENPKMYEKTESGFNV